MTISEALTVLHLWTARGEDNLVYINYPELLFDYLEDTNEWVEVPLYQNLYRKQAILWNPGKAMEVLVMSVLLQQMNNWYVECSCLAAYSFKLSNTQNMGTSLRMA